MRHDEGAARNPLQSGILFRIVNTPAITAAPAGTVERTMRILESLAHEPNGIALSELADEAGLPRCACHRLLAELVRTGYVRQLREQGEYTLTTRLPALGLSFLGGAGVVDIAQPVIDRVAEASGGLV